LVGEKLSAALLGWASRIADQVDAIKAELLDKLLELNPELETGVFARLFDELESNWSAKTCCFGRNVLRPRIQRSAPAGGAVGLLRYARLLFSAAGKHRLWPSSPRNHAGRAEH
jgi:hypothetical protein